jgi:hypothetical protein
MEALGRVELPTNGLGNRCSIHLSYRATSGHQLPLPEMTDGEPARERISSMPQVNDHSFSQRSDSSQLYRCRRDHV